MDARRDRRQKGSEMVVAKEDNGVRGGAVLWSAESTG